VGRDFNTLHPTNKEFVEFGMQRQAESISALRVLGVPRENIVFLGFPDKGIARLWSEYWDEDERFYSRYTGSSTNPYPNTFEFNVPYNGISLLKDLNKIINDFRPTDIYYPHPNDLHPDHWAVNAFVRYLLELKDLNKTRQHLYIIHHSKWPAPKLPQPSQPMTPPSQLINTGTIWRDFDYSPKEANLKASAILHYVTQVRVMKGFLLSFTRNSELFGSLPDFPIPHLPKLAEIKEETSKTAAIRDPVGNTVALRVNKSADLKEVNSYISDRKWIIDIHTVAPVNPKVVYEVHARVFSNLNSVSRFDIQIKQNRIIWRFYASNSVIDLPGAFAEINHGGYRIVIPIEAIPNSKSVFLNIDTLLNNFKLDKTAWRVLRFPVPLTKKQQVNAIGE
jgi:LmbE family N-acetylglucosaminyl deacetylase